MAEYIEREAAIEWFMPYVHIGGYIAADSVVCDIRSLPTADVAPVVRGRWVKHSVDGTDMFGEPTEIVFACNCSVCGIDGRSETPYCPNCGAKMEESESKWKKQKF